MAEITVEAIFDEITRLKKENEWLRGVQKSLEKDERMYRRFVSRVDKGGMIVCAEQLDDPEVLKRAKAEKRVFCIGGNMYVFVPRAASCKEDEFKTNEEKGGE